MTRRNSFWGSLLFAAMAAAVLPAALLALSSSLGGGRVLALYLVGTTSAYVAWLAPSLRRAVTSGLVVALSAGLLVALISAYDGHAMAQLAIGCSLLVAVCRSVFFYPARPLRGLLLECGLTVGGLLIARLLAGPSALAMAAALWGYLLVQSLFWLTPGWTVRASGGKTGDAFEQASSRLQALLEEAS